MNTRSYLTPTKKYKTLISSVHSIYRLVNTTYQTKELICRLARLICQVFNGRYCLIMLLDPTRRFSIFKCLISDGKKYVVDRKAKISNHVEKRIVNTVASVRQEYLLGLPLVCGDISGII